MQRDIVIKGRSLGGSSDLALLAPIKPGFAESLDSVTYKTRIKRVLETLHGARTATYEYAPARLLSDSVERVGAIHSVRVAVLEPEDKVLLAVTFDGSWESYIRVLWDKVGTLLDLIFCGTVDYVTAYDHTFEEWLVWARRVQVETGFFYGPADSTARDVLYERRIERMRVRGAGADLNEADLNEIRAVLPSAEEAVKRIVHPPKVLQTDDPPILQPVDYNRMFRERFRNGMQGLAGLYRLADLHRPTTPDGEVLRRAAIDLLLEFIQLWSSGLVNDDIDEARDGAVPGSRDGRFPRQLDWLFPDHVPKPNKRPRPQNAESSGDTVPDTDLAEIQGGIVRAYPAVTHGVVAMLAFRNAQGARDFLAWSSGRVTDGTQKRSALPKKPFFNIAFTVSGLRAAGMDEDTLELFPEDFRQGMAARAGLLGDVRNNHPRRWRLPRRIADLNPPSAGTNNGEGFKEIELDTIHVVVQLRCQAPAGVPADVEITDPLHPLHDAVEELLRVNAGVELLSVQALVRRPSPGLPDMAQEHFGYADGLGQPEVEAGPVPNDANRVHLGEIVHGYANAADFKLDPADPSVPDAVKARLRWMTNGSFLVMRKYRQFVHRFESAVEATAKEMALAFPADPTDFPDLVYAKLMGRARNGVPVGQQTVNNTFDYTSDQQGKLCPLHAHIRLAHPRADKNSAARLPRLMRRGMSYGPWHTKDADEADIERGVLFMAYNASFSEQYEVVQRWLTGGNSTGSSSGQSCPIVGVPENGFARQFRFEHNGKMFRVELEEGTPLFEEPNVLTRLEWGMYLFVPSLGALQKLRALAAAADAAVPAASVPWEILRGRHLIAELGQVLLHEGDAAAAAAWKTVIEDPESIDRLDSAAVWAAIRDDHGGTLKTSYGTLVASRELLMQVLLDPDERYSISGQFERMQRSVGEIYLGRDPGPRYADESGEINKAIGELTGTISRKEQVFEIAFKGANRKLDAIVSEAKRHSEKLCDPRFEVGFDVREVVDEVLADLCDAWFGLQGSPHFHRGPANWAWKDGDPPLYPGHFTALSRYMFQPNPGPLSVELGELYGQGLRKAMIKFVSDHRAAGTTPKQADGSAAPIGVAIFSHSIYGADDDWVARTMVGVLMGFIAPIIGALLNVLREWQREGRFAGVRAELGGRTARTDASAVLAGPMTAAARMRPMPQIVWRLARKPHRLGPPGADAIDVAVGEKIVLGLVSGTQQSLADGQDDEHLMFGGKRSSAPHPTHACPGYEAGIEAMLGALTALLTRAEKMRQGFAPLTFLAEGPCPLTPDCLAKANGGPTHAGILEYHANVAFALVAKFHAALPPKPPVRTGLVLVVGDSWVDNPYVIFHPQDLRSELSGFGYDAPPDLCGYEEWGMAEILAARVDDICRTITAKIQSLPHGKLPKAVLLSAGGNDSTRKKFLALLNKNDNNPASRAINGVPLGLHIADLRKKYVTVIDKIKATLVKLNTDIPVIVHGYDHPVLPPGIFGRPEWFRDQFKAMLYDKVRDRQKEIDALADLINAFNCMLFNLAGEPGYKPFVRYVNLRGTIANYWTNPADGWFDDMHPVDNAFFALATKIDDAIQAPYP